MFCATRDWRLHLSQGYAQEARHAREQSGISHGDQAAVMMQLSSKFARGGDAGADATAEDGTFRPFAANPEKQMRYEKFLEHRDRGAVLEACRQAGMQEWQANHEVRFGGKKL
jgi:hypothetical protein